MPRGGRREGAGRPKGSGNGRTVEIRSVSMLPSAWEKLDKLRGQASRGMWISATVAAIALEGAIGVRCRVALNHELALSPRMVTAEDFKQLRVNDDVARRFMRLRTKELRRLDSNQPFVPSKRGPGEQVNFVASQSCHCSKQEDLELFGLRGGQLAARTFEQRCHVKCAAIASRAHPLDFHASEWKRIWKFTEIFDSRDDFSSEERAGSPNETVCRHLGALFRERIRRAALDETDSPFFDCLARERGKLDVVDLGAPGCASAAAIEPMDIARDLAQSDAVTFKRLGINQALFAHCAQVFADRYVDLLLCRTESPCGDAELRPSRT